MEAHQKHTDSSIQWSKDEADGAFNEFLLWHIDAEA